MYIYTYIQSSCRQLTLNVFNSYGKLQEQGREEYERWKCRGRNLLNYIRYHTCRLRSYWVVPVQALDFSDSDRISPTLDLYLLNFKGLTASYEGRHYRLDGPKSTYVSEPDVHKHDCPLHAACARDDTRYKSAINNKSKEQGCLPHISINSSSW